MRTLLISLCALVLCVSAHTVRYDHYKVLEVEAATREQLDYLRHLQFSDVEIDFWDEVHRLEQGPIKLMVSPKKLARLAPKLLGNGIKFKVVIDNVQEDIDKEQARLSFKKAFDLDDFNRLEDIESELEKWAATSGGDNPNFDLADIGTTYEGRKIKRFTVSSGAGKPSMYLDATIHAREWLATATILKMLNYFTTNYNSDTELKAMIDAYDWHFVPVVNPDGYVQSWTERLWRKNRAVNSGSDCLGTDLNRNFDWTWGREGVSHDPCADTYCGSAGNSELETQAVVRELTRLSGLNELVGLVTFHSYGNMWMHPWGYTVDNDGFECARAPDHDTMYRVATAAKDAIEQEGGGTWKWGTSCEVIYETTGATDDWAKGALKVKFPYNPELRGSSFVVDTDQIDLSYREIMAGLKAWVEAINKVRAEE